MESYRRTKKVAIQRNLRDQVKEKTLILILIEGFLRTLSTSEFIIVQGSLNIAREGGGSLIKLRVDYGKYL